jgi:hypothetical protein
MSTDWRLESSTIIFFKVFDLLEISFSFWPQVRFVFFFILFAFKYDKRSPTRKNWKKCEAAFRKKTIEWEKLHSERVKGGMESNKFTSFHYYCVIWIFTFPRCPWSLFQRRRSERLDTQRGLLRALLGLQHHPRLRQLRHAGSGTAPRIDESCDIIQWCQMDSRLPRGLRR